MSAKLTSYNKISPEDYVIICHNLKPYYKGKWADFNLNFTDITWNGGLIEDYTNTDLKRFIEEQVIHKDCYDKEFSQYIFNNWYYIPEEEVMCSELLSIEINKQKL